MSQVGQPRTKYWCFTINNPSSDEIPELWDDVEFCFWQREKGEQGTEHLQGYIGFNTNKRLTWLKKNTTRGAHWEPRKGSHEQARDYVVKSDTRIAGPFERGSDEKVGKGKRNDLLSLKRKLDDGMPEKQIMEEEDTFSVWAKYWKIIPRYRFLKSGQRQWATETIVYWGAPGIGKSSRALSEAGPDAFWLSKPGGQTAWWDGYHGQAVVVIDEFYGWIARDLMCRICDRYPLNVETKGGSTPFLARKIIITSNEHPVAWWPKVGLGAMERRLAAPIGVIVEMTVPWAQPGPPMSTIPPAPPVVVNEALLSDEYLPPTPHEYIEVSIQSPNADIWQVAADMRELGQAAPHYPGNGSGPFAW